MARLEIFLKYASNILKFKNFPNHGEAREPFKNIFGILIKKRVYKYLNHFLKSVRLKIFLK